MHVPRFLKAIAIVLAATSGLWAFAPLAEAVGFQQLSIPDADDRPLLIGIWYPSETPVQRRSLELYGQDVARDGTISGDRLPLVVMSHGTGESLSAHYDTAIALAEAGFVVAAVTHTGDNFKDHSYAFTQRNFVGRARHVHRVIDYLLGVWPERRRLDLKRIGAFGHSAGGFTVLLAVGGVPDFGGAVQFCAAHPEAWECQQMGQVRRETPTATEPIEPRFDP